MTRKLFISSIFLLIAGFFGRIYAVNYTYIDNNNILHDTAWLPISSLMLLAGILCLLISAVLFAVRYLSKSQKTSS